MTKELKNKSEKELKKDLAQKREEVRKTRFSLSGVNSKNIKSIKENKRDIARLLTEINSR